MCCISNAYLTIVVFLASIQFAGDFQQTKRRTQTLIIRSILHFLLPQSLRAIFCLTFFISKLCGLNKNYFLAPAKFAGCFLIEKWLPQGLLAQFCLTFFISKLCGLNKKYFLAPAKFADYFFS